MKQEKEEVSRAQAFPYFLLPRKMDKQSHGHPVTAHAFVVKDCPLKPWTEGNLSLLKWSLVGYLVTAKRKEANVMPPLGVNYEVDCKDELQVQTVK